MVQEEDVEFNSITNSEGGNLEVTFFVKQGSTVLKKDILMSAVMVRKNTCNIHL